MPKCWNFKLVCVFLLSLFLIACGGGDQPEPEQISPDISSDISPDKVKALSASINLEKISMNLGQENSAEIVLTRKFDDDSETKLNLLISWVADNLVLKDTSDNVIQLVYDKDLLLAGKTAVKFVDPETNLDIEFEFELIPEQTALTIKQYILSPDAIQLTIGDSADLTISVTMSDDSEGTVSADVKCQLAEESTVISVSEGCKLSALEAGEANVTLIATESIDETLIQKANIIVLPPSVPHVIKAEIQPPVTSLIEGQDLVLSVKLTYSDDAVTFDEFNLVKCQSVSINIVVSADCKLSAKSSGMASIQLLMLNASDAQLVGVDVDIQTPTITQLTVIPESLTLKAGEQDNVSVKVLADYNNGDTAVDVTALSRCILHTGLGVISVSESCDIDALTKGDAEITAELALDPTIKTTAVVKVTVSPADLAEVKINSHSPTLIEGLELPLFVSLTYSNGDVKENDFSVVKCTTSSVNITITGQCYITANSPGTAVINLEVLVDGTPMPILVGSQIEIVARSITQLRIVADNPRMQVGDDQFLKILADYDNNTTANITTSVSCFISLGDSFISVLNADTESCHISAIQNGYAEVSAALAVGPVIDFVTVAKITVSEALVLNSGETQILDSSFFGGGVNTKVTCTPDYALSIGTDCVIYALMPGEYDVIGTLSNTASAQDLTVSLPVVIKAAPIGDLSLDINFPFTIVSDVTAIVYEVSNASIAESYKVTLGQGFIPANTRITVFPDLQSSNTCTNTLPAFTYSNVACGFKTSTDKFYIRLELLDPNAVAVGMSANLNIVTDADILHYAGPIKTGVGTNPSYLNKYDFASLTVDLTLVDEHVPANLDGANTSRYISSADLGMNPTASGKPFYNVLVTFDSANFEANSVKVKWYGNNDDEIGIPEYQCSNPSINELAKTWTCTIENTSQNYIFVEVRGSGEENAPLSNITAIDGEIGYTITLTQIP